MNRMKDLIEEWKKPQYPSELVIKIANKLFSKNSKILDFGCGGGRNFFYLLSNFDAFGCEEIEELVDHVKNRLNENDRHRVLNNPKTKIPFQDNYFDGVLVYGVIGLNDSNKGEIYKEIMRVTKTNGYFIIEYTDKKSIITNRYTNVTVDYKLYDEDEIMYDLSKFFGIDYKIAYEESFFEGAFIKRWLTYGKIVK